MEQKTPLIRARSYVLWLLARRDYPRRQLEDKLRKRDLAPKEIQKVLDSLIADGFYKEATFKKLRTRQLLRRGYGPSLVKAKMSRDRIAPTNEEIALAYDELSLSPKQQISQLIAKIIKRYRHLELQPRELKQRVMQALLRKGFSSATIIKQINAFFDRSNTHPNPTNTA